MCQRPKRALFISTGEYKHLKDGSIEVCQRPKRALFISTNDLEVMIPYQTHQVSTP